MVMLVGEIGLTMTWPDDWHLHLRDEWHMKDVVGYSARQFARALIMPNLKPPVRTVAKAIDYRQRIKKALPEKSGFEPLMTLYLTDNTHPGEVIAAKKRGFIPAVKYYPAGATTNSDSGVTNIEKVYPVLEVMEEVGMVLCVHGEVTYPHVDVFDREKVFLDVVLGPLRERYQKLKIVLEHVTTREGVDFVLGTGPRTAATITAHHLLINRNALFAGGIRPHYFCLPVAKREGHRMALLSAATNGSPKFFFGSDSAPHARETKEADCGCAGCFTAMSAIEQCAEVFEGEGKLEMLEGFTSHFGADFYGVPRNTGTISLLRKEWEIPHEVKFGESTVVPFRAGQKVRWKMA